MTEKGVVVKEVKNGVMVEIPKKDECSKCGLCAFPRNADKIRVFAENNLGAKIGDSVTVERSGATSLISILMIFLVPLILIGLTVGANYLWIKNEIWIPIISVILIAIWYVVLALTDKKFQKLKGLVSVIIDVDKKEDKDERDNQRDE